MNQVWPLALSALLYALGARRRRGVRTFELYCFWTGWVVLALALLSPLHELGEKFFSAHMIQHELLILAAAPLLVLSRPLVPMLWGLPFGVRRNLGQWSRTRVMQKVWRGISSPGGAWTIHAAALWLWHAPVMFQATLHSEWMHAAQHLSFFLSALLFWWSLFFARGAEGYGTAVLSVFTTGVHTSILGALLTFSKTAWYPDYGTPLEDQQIGGLIMWVPAGLVYVIAGLVLMGLWMRQSDRMRLVIGIMAVLVCGGCGVRAADQSAGVAAIGRYGCGSCHTIGQIRGANGLVGPPLTGIGSRLYVAGMLENSEGNLATWIHDPKAINPKTAMPKLGVTDGDARTIAAFLEQQ
jgi:putative membrane protein